MLTLGIETSCDETSVAVVREGREILSNVISSQIPDHAPYGGVVPEIASRQHLRALPRTLQTALDEAGVELLDLDAVAVTSGPGLIGALLVGVSAAKGLAWGLDLPLKGVHHLDGHLAAVALTHPGETLHPSLGLVVSGGHSHLYHLEEPGRARLLGRTRDDAAGEAFDKVGKAMGLPYPAGPVIDRLAEQGDPGVFELPRPRVSGHPLDLSFSGLKTSVTRILGRQEGPLSEAATADLLAEFRAAVVDILIDRLRRALAQVEVACIQVTGGVAANALLRRRAQALGEELQIPVYFPSLALSGDNAAMIAAAGYDRLSREPPDDVTLDAVASWDLTTL